MRVAIRTATRVSGRERTAYGEACATKTYRGSCGAKMRDSVLNMSESASDAEARA